MDLSKSRRARRVGVPLALLGVAIAGAPAASACTGEPVSIQWMADHAAHVIVADVASIESAWAGENGAHQRIESTVTLTNVRYLKGDGDADGAPPQPAPLSIVFPGGSVDGYTMRLCCAPELEVGQRWIMFLQPEYKTYPTAGLGQGILSVRRDGAGVERVHTARGLALTSIDERGVPLSAVAGEGTAPARQPAGIIGDGIRVRPLGRQAAPTPEARAMTLDEFAERVAPVLEASRVYELDHPVARRIETTLTPVPLREVDHHERAPASAPERTAAPERADLPPAKTPSQSEPDGAASR